MEANINFCIRLLTKINIKIIANNVKTTMKIVQHMKL
jgi:hypothetical protein